MIASITSVVALSSIFAISLAAPLQHVSRSLVARDSYHTYPGDGSVAQGWPAKTDWKDFETLWNANEQTIGISCTQYGQENNTPDEMAGIKQAIKDVSTESNLPNQFLFAVMMQESKGCVRAPRTNNGINNPGLMQSFRGSAFCFDVKPCPQDKIKTMIEEGAGIGTDFGLKQALAEWGGNGGEAQKLYRAARAYNSGNVNNPNLAANGATTCYVSDIANRMIGWVDGDGICEPGALAAALPSGSGGEEPATAPQTPHLGSATDGTDQETTSTPPSNIENSSDAPKAQGASAQCTKWYMVKANDTCASVGISFDRLKSLNAGVDANCSNLMAGTKYCIAA